MPRILIVDDDVGLLHGLQRYLSRFAPVDGAVHRVQARRQVQQHRYDVVVMDLTVDRDHGVDIVRHLLAEQPHAIGSVVFHTGQVPLPQVPLGVAVPHAVVSKGDLQGLVDAVLARIPRAGPPPRRRPSTR